MFIGVYGTRWGRWMVKQKAAWELIYDEYFPFVPCSRQFRHLGFRAFEVRLLRPPTKIVIWLRLSVSVVDEGALSQCTTILDPKCG